MYLLYLEYDLTNQCSVLTCLYIRASNSLGKEESSGCQGAAEHHFNCRTINECNQVEHCQKSSESLFVLLKKKKRGEQALGQKWTRLKFKSVNFKIYS